MNQLRPATGFDRKAYVAPETDSGSGPAPAPSPAALWLDVIEHATSALNAVIDAPGSTPGARAAASTALSASLAGATAALGATLPADSAKLLQSIARAHESVAKAAGMPAAPTGPDPVVLKKLRQQFDLGVADAERWNGYENTAKAYRMVFGDLASDLRAVAPSFAAEVRKYADRARGETSIWQDEMDQFRMYVEMVRSEFDRLLR